MSTPPLNSQGRDLSIHTTIESTLKKQPLIPRTKYLPKGPVRGVQVLHPRKRDSVLFYERSPSFHSEVSSDIDAPHSTLSLGSKQSASSKDMDYDLSRSENWPSRCSYVLKELLETERVYVHDLGDVVKGYLSPMYSHVLSSGDNPNFIQTVFSNIIKIHQMHMELLEALQSTLSDPHQFGMVFVQWDFLTQYTIYCTGYSKGNKLLEKTLHEDQSLKEFIEQCQKAVGHSLSLSSQLIKPVQRILKYRLLLGELIKHFDREHSAYRTLKDALDKMSSVAEEINAAFHAMRSPSKSSPSAIARKRTHQLRDLQRSRTIGARTEHIEHIVQHSYIMFNSKGSARSCSNDSPTFTKQQTGYTYLQTSRTSCGLSFGSTHQTCCVSMKNHRHSSSSEPCVHELKSYFESLATSEKEGQLRKDRKKAFLTRGNCKSGHTSNISPKSEMTSKSSISIA